MVGREGPWPLGRASRPVRRGRRPVRRGSGRFRLRAGAAGSAGTGPAIAPHSVLVSLQCVDVCVHEVVPDPVGGGSEEIGGEALGAVEQAAEQGHGVVDGALRVDVAQGGDMVEGRLRGSCGTMSLLLTKRYMRSEKAVLNSLDSCRSQVRGWPKV